MKTYTTMDAIGDIFVIYGIVIVVSMLVAVVIRGIVWALSRGPTETAKAPAKPVPALQPVVAGVPQEHLAVITATIAAMLGAHRIVRIEAPGRSYSWTAEARTVHHTSHTPHKS
ncbi:MAG: OadG family protein [Candidatus Competibacter sp.]|nr:OadG family protein [Candidatus Competibacter sp.]MDG4583654.1 OadG family protein [Candidatus Competibacter sp.]